DRRQYPEGIGGQKEDDLGVSPDSGDFGRRDMFDRVGSSGIFCQSVIMVVRAALIIQRHVFQHGTKTDSVPDLGFFFTRQVDTLGVTAAFYVEDPAVGPPMFVITDQAAGGISRQGGFTGSGET